MVSKYFVAGPPNTLGRSFFFKFRPEIISLGNFLELGDFISFSFVFLKVFNVSLLNSYFLSVSLSFIASLIFASR